MTDGQRVVRERDSVRHRWIQGGARKADGLEGEVGPRRIHRLRCLRRQLRCNGCLRTRPSMRTEPRPEPGEVEVRMLKPTQPIGAGSATELPAAVAKATEPPLSVVVSRGDRLFAHSWRTRRWSMTSRLHGQRASRDDAAPYTSAGWSFSMICCVVPPSLTVSLALRARDAHEAAEGAQAEQTPEQAHG